MIILKRAFPKPNNRLFFTLKLKGKCWILSYGKRVLKMTMKNFDRAGLRGGV